MSSAATASTVVIPAPTWRGAMRPNEPLALLWRSPPRPISPEIEVRRERGRAPTIVLRGEPERAALRLGAGEFHVSISHSGDYAVAFVVSE